ncbi:MAG: hypothetical protein RJA22_1714 [Verrucomicrobiota bacterium]|jgi:hypothetical protein
MPDAAPAGTRTSAHPPRWLFGCLGAIALLVGITGLAVWLLIPGARYIGSLPDGQPYTATRFEFHYGPATRAIQDPSNLLQIVHGEMPDSITVSNGTRLILYRAPKAILKSTQDSVEVRATEVIHGGHLGMQSKGTNFVVDAQGRLQAR